MSINYTIPRKLSDKQNNYKKLIKERSECDSLNRNCMPFVLKNEGVEIHLINPGELEHLNPNDAKQFQCNEIGPTTLAQKNLDANIVVIAQDYGPVSEYKNARENGYSGGFWPINEKKNPYLRRMNEYLGKVLNVPEGKTALQSNGHEEYDLFMTNVMLCLKRPMKNGSEYPKFKCTSGYFNKEWAYNCCHSYMTNLLDKVVLPKIVITVGELSIKAILHAYYPEEFSNCVIDGTPMKNAQFTKIFLDYYNIVQYPKSLSGKSFDKFEEVFKFPIKSNGGHDWELFPVWHCGSLGMSNRKRFVCNNDRVPIDWQQQDTLPMEWQKICERYSKIKSKPNSF